LFHYVLVGAASLLYVNAPEARLLTGIEPTSPRWVETHAEGLVAMLLPNAPRAGRRRGGGVNPGVPASLGTSRRRQVPKIPKSRR
jgi:hypothetical protein